MRYAYFPGCSLHSAAEEYDQSATAVCKRLGIELKEIEDWLCCGSTPAHITNHLASVALPISSCAWAEKQKLDVLTCCAACFCRFKVANHEVREDKELLAKVNEVIEEDYQGEVDVYHLLEVIMHKMDKTKLAAAMQKPLKGLKVACYYGCLLTRLPEKLRLDHQEEPTMMDDLVRLAGAEAIEWPYKTECCGASLAIVQPKTVLRLANDILTYAEENGADCVIVACPLCQSNLDLLQSQVNKEYKKSFHLPIFYFTQLLGLAMGIEKEDLALSKLIVDPLPLLSEKGLVERENLYL